MTARFSEASQSDACLPRHGIAGGTLDREIEAVWCGSGDVLQTHTLGGLRTSSSRGITLVCACTSQLVVVLVWEHYHNSSTRRFQMRVRVDFRRQRVPASVKTAWWTTRSDDKSSHHPSLLLLRHRQAQSPNMACQSSLASNNYMNRKGRASCWPGSDERVENPCPHTCRDAQTQHWACRCSRRSRRPAGLGDGGDVLVLKNGCSKSSAASRASARRARRFAELGCIHTFHALIGITISGSVISEAMWCHTGFEGILAGHTLH